MKWQIFWKTIEEKNFYDDKIKGPPSALLAPFSKLELGQPTLHSLFDKRNKQAGTELCQAQY